MAAAGHGTWLGHSAGGGVSGVLRTTVLAVGMTCALSGCITVHVAPTPATMTPAPTQDEAGARRLATLAEREGVFAGFTQWSVIGALAWVQGTSKGDGSLRWGEREGDLAVLLDIKPGVFRGGLVAEGATLHTLEVEGNQEAPTTPSVAQVERWAKQAWGKPVPDVMRRVLAWTKGIRHTPEDQVIFHGTSGLPWKIQSGEWGVEYLAWHLDGAYPLPAELVIRHEALTVQMKLSDWLAHKPGAEAAPNLGNSQQLVAF